MHLSVRIAATAFALGATALALAQAASDAAPATSLQTVTVHAVAHFDFDRTTVLPADQKRLLSEVATLKDVTWRTVAADGYADSVGNPNYNKRLSMRRAEAVRAYLVGQGLSPSMIRTEGKGEDAPVADNATAEGRAQNRRTEVTFEGVRTVASSR